MLNSIPINALNKKDRNPYYVSVLLIVLVKFLEVSPLHSAESHDLCRIFLIEHSKSTYEKLSSKVDPLIDIEQVDINKGIRVEAPTQCETRGLGPCVGIALINTQSKTAYLLHQYADTDDYQNFVKNAIQEAEKVSDLRVAIVGSVRENENGKLSAHQSQDVSSIIEYLSENGIPKRNIATAVGPRDYQDGYYNMRVDPATGKVHVTYVFPKDPYAFDKED